jgi:Lipocalin-like domain
MRTSSILALTLLLASLGAWAEDPNTIVGSWKLVSVAATSADGKSLASPMGEHPTGLLLYSADGRMSLIITHQGRPKLSGDRLDSPTEERANAFSTMVAYAGSYRMEGNKLIHHVEAASSQNWVGTELPRIVTFDGNRVKLEAPLLERHGVVQRFEQVWERITQVAERAQH